MSVGFGSITTFAKMNYIVDIVRGNNPPIHWDVVSKEIQEQYLDEVKVAGYILEQHDVDLIMNKIASINCITQKDYYHG